LIFCPIKKSGMVSMSFCSTGKTPRRARAAMWLTAFWEASVPAGRTMSVFADVHGDDDEIARSAGAAKGTPSDSVEAGGGILMVLLGIRLIVIKSPKEQRARPQDSNEARCQNALLIGRVGHLFWVSPSR
jgi:hypothetical protein